MRAVSQGFGMSDPYKSDQDAARDQVERLIKACYDRGNTLSDDSAIQLRLVVGKIIQSANARLFVVAMKELGHELMTLARRNGGDEQEGHIPFAGEIPDYFDITGGEKFGNDQWAAKGTIRSTGEQALLFVSPDDEHLKELLVYSKPDES